MKKTIPYKIGFGAHYTPYEDTSIWLKEIFVTSAPKHDIPAKLYLSINDGEYTLIDSKTTIYGTNGTLFNINVTNIKEIDTYKIKVVFPSEKAESNILTLTTSNIKQYDV